MNLLFLLIKTKKPQTLEQLIQKINRDESTVFRALQKLVRLEICLKDAKMIKEGGYYHVYTATDTQTLKIETKRVKEIKESFDRLLRRFEADMNKAHPQVLNFLNLFTYSENCFCVKVVPGVNPELSSPM